MYPIEMLQCSIVITLLDLKNAFGEVYHKLIYEVLRYHHIPDHIVYLIESLYSGFHTLIITSDFLTSYVVYFRVIIIVPSSSNSTLIHLSTALSHKTIVNLDFLIIAAKVLILFTGFNLQTMQL